MSKDPELRKKSRLALVKLPRCSLWRLFGYFFQDTLLESLVETSPSGLISTGSGSETRGGAWAGEDTVNLDRWEVLSFFSMPMLCGAGLVPGEAGALQQSAEETQNVYSYVEQKPWLIWRRLCLYRRPAS